MQREKRANIRGMLGMFKGMWRKPFSLDKINPMAREGGGGTHGDVQVYVLDG